MEHSLDCVPRDALQDAVPDAVRARVRPIFMTTATSLAGLLPMVDFSRCRLRALPRRGRYCVGWPRAVHRVDDLCCAECLCPLVVAQAFNLITGLFAARPT